jgi:adenylate cyclase
MSESQLIGTPLFQALPCLSGDVEDQLSRIHDQETQETVEKDVTLDNDARRVWKIVMSPLRGAAGGQTQGTVLVLDDLTEQRERENQLAHVRRYLPLALWENIRSEDVAALGGQERNITVLFADVRGFTTFSERLDPQRLMEIINKYLSVASDSINLFEGVVDKYIGDAVTGLFNTPLNAQSDHALRAVRAALSMVYDVQALHEVLPEEERLFYGIGVHTGSAVLGNVGSPERREFCAIGDAVELSKLLQENANRGEIIVSAETYAYVKDTFEFEALVPRKTKGRTDLTVMYKVLGRKKRGTGELAETTLR